MSTSQWNRSATTPSISPNDSPADSRAIRRSLLHAAIQAFEPVLEFGQHGDALAQCASHWPSSCAILPVDARQLAAHLSQTLLGRSERGLVRLGLGLHVRFCLFALVELGPEKLLLALELGGLGAELFLIGLGSLEL